MRIIDSIPDANNSPLHKLMFIEEDTGEFSILGQASNRCPVHLQEHLTVDAARSYWRKACMCHFYKATHNERDAEAMADKRVSDLH